MHRVFGADEGPDLVELSGSHQWECPSGVSRQFEILVDTPTWYPLIPVINETEEDVVFERRTRTKNCRDLKVNMMSAAAMAMRPTRQTMSLIARSAVNRERPPSATLGLQKGS